MGVCSSNKQIKKLLYEEKVVTEIFLTSQEQADIVKHRYNISNPLL
jgi:hypothetical protein